MYAVIFSATINELDDEYSSTAEKMRALATEKYGCADFKAIVEENQEITISYWPSIEHIKNWKYDPYHIEAQRVGQERWYSDYKVHVVRIEREYEKHT